MRLWPLLLAPAVALATPSGHKWFNRPVTYRVFAHSSINGIPNFSTDVLPRVQNAFLNWTSNRVACTNWASSYGGTFSSPSGTAAVNGSDGINNVIWLGGSQWTHGSSTLGLTTTGFFAGSGEIFDADMELNNNIPWSNSGAFNAQDMESVVLHEAGHFLGLDHTNSNQVAVMYPTIAPGEIKRTLTSPDVTDVCAVYPGTGTPGGQGTPCTQGSNCINGLVCRAALGSTSKICTVDCTSGQSCPSGYTCQDADVGRACLVPVGSPDLCKFCTDGSQCSSGNCVSDGQHNWCTIACASAANCGPGYACVSSGAGGNVCVPQTSCANQCTSAAQCASGYGCVGGECEATGNVGDRCELSGFCKPCGVCIGTSAAAFCRSCCNNQGYCQSCTATTCASGHSCQALNGDTARVCIPSSGGNDCQPCDIANNPCAQGLICVGGRCHNSCNPSNPGGCTACYNAGGGNGYCACPDEVSLAGDPCGPAGNGAFRACVTGLLCVGLPSPVCRRPCTLGNNSTCNQGEVCQAVDGQAVCVISTAPGSMCSACQNGSCNPGLTCFQGRCYQACNPAAPTCTTCTEVQAGIGVCACEDQRAGVNQACGFVPPGDVYTCQFGLLCVNGTCRMECNLNNPFMCPVGTSCQVLGGIPYCLPPPGFDAGTGGGGGGGGGFGGFGGGGGGGGGGSVSSQGCGCLAGAGAAALWPLVVVLGLGARRRKRHIS
ncbi:MAG: matrixin family metalloprotease [Myxococcota bacterium]